MIFRSIIILTTFIYFFSNISCLHVSSASYYVSNSKFFSQEVVSAQFDVTVNQTLYFTDSMFCLTPESCPKFGEDPEDYCDYTREDSLCGSGNSSFGCQNSDLCDTYQYKWNTLHEGQVFKGMEIPEFELPMFLFYFDSMDCKKGIKIKITKVYGRITAGFSRGKNIEQPNQKLWDWFFDSRHDLCPSQNGYGSGTYFMGIWSQTPKSKIDIELEFYDIDPNNKKDFISETEIVCGFSPTTILCPSFGVPFNGVISSSKTVIIKIPVLECMHLLMAVEPRFSFGQNFLLLVNMNTPSLKVKGYIFQESKHSRVLTICPDITQQSNESVFYITLLTGAVDLRYNFYISLDQDEWNSVKRPLSSLHPYGDSPLFQGIMQLQCPKQLFPCYLYARSYPGSCEEFYTTPPRNDGNYLWPVPLIFEDTTTDQILFEDDHPDQVLESNKIKASLILESYGVNGFFVDITVSLDDWRKSLENCSLSFLPFSLMTDEQGQIMREKIDLKGIVQEPDCDFEEFQKEAQKFDELTKSLLESETFSQVTTSRYEMDLFSFSKTWTGCDQKVQRFLDVKQTMKHFNETVECTNDMLKNITIRETDACCNQELSWGTCCVERDVDTSVTSFSLGEEGSKTQQLLNSECKHPDCAQSLMGDYIFYDYLLDSISGCGSIVNESLQEAQYRDMKWYRDCRVEVFGNDQIGKPCVVDTDCPSEKCDVFNSRCLIDGDDHVDKVSRLFFECLVEKMPSSLRGTLISISIEPNSKPNTNTKKLRQQGEEQSNEILSNEQLIQYLIENFMKSDCNNAFGRSDKGSRFEVLCRLLPTICGYNDWYCFDQTCEIPMTLELVRTWGRPSTICWRAMVFQNTTELICEETNEFICNWNSSLFLDLSQPMNELSEQQMKELCEQPPPPQDQPQQETGFCGICESETSCVEIELSQEDCEKSGEVCVSKNGEVDWTIKTKEECFEKWGQCSIESCHQQPNGCDRKTCQTFGSCSDQEVISRMKQYTLAPKVIGDIDKLGGFCLSKLDEWNEMDCNQGAGITLNYTEAVNWSDFPIDKYCVRIKSKELCENFADLGYWWWDLSKNQDECEKRSSSCFETWIPTIMKTSKNQIQCESCKSELISSFQWTKGVWRGGKMKKPEWRQREFVQVNHWGNGIDFKGLNELFNELVSNDYLLRLQTEAQCRTIPIREVVEQIVCVCENGEDQCQYLQERRVNVGVGELCVNSSSSVLAPPSVISFEDNSLRDHPSCVDLNVFAQLQQTVESSEVTTLSFSFRAERKTSQNVWNFEDALVGLTIGTGIHIEFDGMTENSTMTNVKVCLLYDKSNVLGIKENNLIFDLGIIIGSKVYPTGKRAYLDDELICVENLTISQSTISYFPILRQQNWDTQSKEEYSSSQIGVYSLMAILYSLPLIVLIHHQITLKMSFQVNRFFYISFICALAVRFSYFVGLLIEQPDGSETVLEFIGLQFPSFAYLSAVTGAAMLWAFIKNPRNKQRTKQLTIFGNILLYIFFIISVILFVDFQENGSYSCYGRIYQDADTSNTQALQIAYACILCFFSLVMGGIVMYFSGSLFMNLAKVNAGESNPRIRAWLTVTVVIAFSVILQSIFLAIYSTQIDKSYKYCLLLILFEIIPSLSILKLVLTVERVSSVSRQSKPVPQSSELPDIRTKE